MPTIDIVILAILAIGLIDGLRKGFVNQLASVVGVIVGLFVARSLYWGVAQRITPLLGTSSGISELLAFVLIWGAVPVLFSCLATLLAKLLDAVNMGWLDRWLGAALGALKCMFIISILIHGLEYFQPKYNFISDAEKRESKFYYPVKELSSFFFPIVKDVTKQLTI
ncbi:MAG: CvpA family protein [Phocaeicola sp.]